ncbi:MAG TPA: glycosyltransferase [Bradyrhizobium sp.]|nr:glycosyltransferase [Bradyrhizobium sp.]
MSQAPAARRIHWLSWQPTPYNDYLFQHLAEDSAIDLTVHYRSRVLSSHPWQSDLAQGYRARFYNLVLGLDWHLLSLAFRDRHAFFLVAGWDHPTSQTLLTLLRLFGLSYGLWTDTPDLNKKRSPLFARARATWLRWIFSGAVRILGTGLPALQGLKEMGASEGRLINFPYWVDLAAYARATKPRGHDAGRPLRFISSGRIKNHLKGHDIAVRALAQAAEKGGRRFEYCIAGTGPDETEIKELVDSLGLKDRVRCLGWLEPDSLRDLYQNSDALIHPSPVHEPYGVAVIEAMAAELVVFASDVTCAAKDRIEHGMNGFIHRAGDVNALSEQLNFLLHSPDSISKIGRRARDTAELWPVERAVDTIRKTISA